VSIEKTVNYSPLSLTKSGLGYVLGIVHAVWIIAKNSTQQCINKVEDHLANHLLLL
ncbi:MAG: hypothetical protein HQK50_18010, partial [Oligoflexia bacterium]|nr:hypothetical protein [Oligoflexia bacterium]